MRAFLGIDLDDEVRAAVTAFADTARRAAPTWAGEKWVPEDNLHLTVRFLGDVERAFVDELLGALAPALGRHDPFAIAPLVPVEPVPGPRHARMLWTRYDDPEGCCDALAATIDDVLAGLGVPPETRPFVPHVTLARARRPRAFPGLPEPPAGPPALLSVREVTLFSSVLSRSGPRYERLDRIPLGVR